MKFERVACILGVWGGSAFTALRIFLYSELSAERSEALLDSYKRIFKTPHSNHCNLMRYSL